jgi:hypothetical protein
MSETPSEQPTEPVPREDNPTTALNSGDPTRTPGDDNPTEQLLTEQLLTEQCEPEQFQTQQFTTEQFRTQQFETQQFQTEQFTTEQFRTQQFEPEQFQTQQFTTPQVTRPFPTRAARGGSRRPSGASRRASVDRAATPPVTSDDTQRTRAVTSPRAWLPIVLAAVGLAAAVVLAVVVILLTTQRGEAPVAAPTESPSPSAAPAAAPAAAPVEPALPAVPVVVPPSRDAATNECVDSTGEGGSVDLESARVAVDDGDLFVTFELTQPPPSGDAGVGIYAEAANGKRSYQVATLWVDGELDEFFVHEFSKGDDEKLDRDDVRLDGTTITARVPDDVLDRLGNDWRWYAYSTVAGANVDACPGDPLTFETLDFEQSGR